MEKQKSTTLTLVWPEMAQYGLWEAVIADGELLSVRFYLSGSAVSSDGFHAYNPSLEFLSAVRDSLTDVINHMKAN